MRTLYECTTLGASTVLDIGSEVTAEGMSPTAFYDQSVLFSALPADSVDAFGAHDLEASRDVDEGMAAHREGRPPRFTGR